MPPVALRQMSAGSSTITNLNRWWGGASDLRVSCREAVGWAGVPTFQLVGRIGSRGCCRLRIPPWRAAPSMPTGRVPVAGRSRVSKSTSGKRRSNPTAFGVIDSESATAWSAVMTPSLRAATAERVWQRQSIEWMDAVLTADPTAIPRSMSRRLQTGPANSSSAGVLAHAARGVKDALRRHVGQRPRRLPDHLWFVTCPLRQPSELDLLSTSGWMADDRGGR